MGRGQRFTGLVFLCSPRQRLLSLGIETAGMNIKHFAHHSDRMLLHVVLDKRVPHPDCFAKYAAAFFKMSRSSVTRRNSVSNFLIRAA
jgi:hypothetical protein